MKTSELIKKLESLVEKHGDHELLFTVKDYYSIYGEQMHINLRCGETTDKPSDWNDVLTTAGYTTLRFHLSSGFGGTHPKITYRK